MTDSPIDIAVFADLQDSMGADFAQELVSTFLQEAPAMLAELARSAAVADADGFRRAAHSIKSNANIFGATTLATMARDMELDGPKPGSVEALTAEYGRTETALRGLLNG